MSDGLRKALDMVEKASYGLGWSQEGVTYLRKVSDGFSKVSDGLGRVSYGLGKLSDSLVGKVSNGLRKVSDGLGKVSTVCHI